MKQGATFYFDDYEVDSNQILFRYSYRRQDEVIGRFCERYVLPFELDLERAGTKMALQNLHIVLGTSYYKSLLGPVKLPYRLDTSEASYWNEVYDNGLAEFAYVNKVSNPIRPFAAEHRAAPTVQSLPDLRGALLGIGGGKDSIVAAEICRSIAIPTTTLDIASRTHRGQAGAVAEAIGFDKVVIERYFDTSLIGFNEQYGGLNGHVPFSAILAWLGVLMALQLSKQYVFMANEASSSVGNTVWNGREINHQWSKSLAFEKATLKLVHSHLSPDIYYVSPVRPFSSLQVMKAFASVSKRYLPLFTSCNLVLRIDPDERPNGRWCGTCAKCLSTWLLLSAWIDRGMLTETFGKDMFNDVSLASQLKALLNLDGHKPLDCVGTYEELRAVTRSALVKYPDAALLQGISSNDIPGPSISELISQRSDHNIPKNLYEQIEQAIALM